MDRSREVVMLCQYWYSIGAADAMVRQFVCGLLCIVICGKEALPPENRKQYFPTSHYACKVSLHPAILLCVEHSQKTLDNSSPSTYTAKKVLLLHSIKDNPYKGSGGNKKLLLCSFPVVGIVRKVPSTISTTQQQTSPQW